MNRRFVVLGVVGAMLAAGLTTQLAAPAAAADASPVTSAKIDFTTESGALATGYTRDIGQAYDPALGFGWVSPTTGAPLDMTLNTRVRTAPADQRLKSLILMQGSGAASQPNVGSWELSVTPGTYLVTVAVGDAGYLDSQHSIVAENTTIIDRFVPTTSAPFSTVTAEIAVPDGKLTLASTGGTNTKIAYVDVAPKVTTPSDTDAPVVTLSAAGSTDSSGNYLDSVTVTLAATDASAITARSYTVNGGAATPYTSPFVLTSAGTYTVVGSATAGGLTGSSEPLVLTLVKTPPGNGKITTSSTEGLPYADRVVLSRIQRPEDGTTPKDPDDPSLGTIPANVVHDRTTLTVRNTGTGPLTVSSLATTGTFTASTTTALPATLAVGASLPVLVTFTATSTSTGAAVQYDGSLTVNSNDAATPAKVVQLVGLWQSFSEKDREPHLVTIAKAFGYTTQILKPGQSLNQKGQVMTVGEEVLSGTWLRADATQPVTVSQLAAYHTQGNTATVSWYAKTTPGTRPVLFSHAGVEGQTVLPHRNGSSTALAAGSFTPAAQTTAFGFRLDSEWSEDARNDQQKDIANGCVAPCGHHVRFFPAYDRSGAVIPNTWLMGMDYAGINYDYQDNVYLVQNMMPELATATNPTRPSVLPGAAGTANDFSAPVAGTLADADGQGTGFTSVQANRTGDAYSPSRLDVGDGTLRIDAFGDATTGSNSKTDNTMLNALQTGFDASLAPFTVQTRLVGPLSNFLSSGRAAGTYFGADQDNYVKLQVISQNSVPRVEMLTETAAAMTQLGVSPVIPTSTTAVDLALVGTPGTAQVTGMYRLVDANGVVGTWQSVGTRTVTSAGQPGKVFSRQQFGGLYANAKGSTPFPAVFDSFAIAPGDLRSPDGASLARIDIGSTSATTTSSGVVWSSDTGLFTPASGPAEGAAVTPLEIANTDDDVVMRTYRGNNGANTTQASRTFSYAVPVPAGTTSVRVRMHFVERYSGNNTTGKRVFSITVEGRQVAADFDPFAAAGGLNTAASFTVPGVAVNDGVVNLDMKALKDYPSLHGLEIFSEASAPPADPAPAAPTAVGAAVAGTDINVTWNAPADADLAGYRVFRSTSPGVPTASPLNPTLIPAGTTSFTDTTPIAGTTYYYVVQAVDTAGSVGPASSPAASATVPAPEPLAAPANLTAAVAGANIGLGWDAVPSADPVTYAIYRSTSSPVDTSVAPLGTTTSRGFQDTTSTPGVASYYVVVATTTSQTSPVSGEVSATVPTGALLALKVNFSHATMTPPPGYDRDFGQAYGLRDGGYSYGWVRVGTATPVDFSTYGRVNASSTVTTDPRLLSFVHMQHAKAEAPGSWELAVPDGTYTVTAAVGDAGTFTDSVHALSVEGVQAIAPFSPTSTNKLRTASVTVTVTDGRLTLAPTGGSNTKLDYVDVVQTS